MRINSFFYPLVVMIIGLISCSKTELIEPSFFVESELSCFVGLDQIYDYIEKQFPSTRGGDISVIPYLSRQDTVMYIINYGKDRGWQILSADSRTPHVLAESGSGVFELDVNNPGLLAWMSCMGTDISFVRHAANEDLVFSKEEVSANMAFWRDRRGKSPRSIDPPEPGGEDEGWHELIVETTQLVDSIPHLTVTQWGQLNPYNYYCPFKSNSNQEKAPAGCVAIAGAQMLFFLHYKFGVPATAPSSAYCLGDTTGWQMSQTNWSTTVWDAMDTTYIETFVGDSLFSVAESPLIANVGLRVGMKYGDNRSGASASDLVDCVFDYYGVSCEYSSFDEDDTINSLLSGIPVIISAQSGFLPLISSRHTFIIDGYRSTRTRYKILHYYLKGDGSLDPNHPPYHTYSYGPTQINAVKMNWGLGTQWSDNLNDGWYSLTGSWVLDNNGLKTYDYYRHMIHGFAPITN